MPCWCDGKCPHIEAAMEFEKKRQPVRFHAALRRALTLAPNCVEANLALANVLVRDNHAASATVHVARAALAGDTPRVKFARGMVLRARTRLPEAIEAFHEALAAEPGNPNISAALGHSLEMTGHAAQAKIFIEAARKTHPQDPEIRRVAAVIADALGDHAGAVEILAADPILKPVEFLDRGRYKEKLGDHAGAWADWMRGKTVLSQQFGHVYNFDQFKKHFDALATAATMPRPTFTRAAPELQGRPAPVFVTGFPRSGTTMMETVLSSHSRIVAGDELAGIADVITAMPAWLKVRVPYPDAMIATTLGENAVIPSLLRDLYLRSAQERIGFGARPAAPKKKKAPAVPQYFTDKMPLNEMHLPLIRLLFPTATVFRMQRHPLDVMVSNMSHWLIHGGFYASSLEACATHYASVDALLQHYKKQFQIADKRGVMDLRYEDFVANQAPFTEQLLGHLGLKLEPACLAFHKNKRQSRTLSYAQVKQPLHDKSIGRWRNFRDQLAPAIEILRPIIEREGYEL